MTVGRLPPGSGIINALIFKLLEVLEWQLAVLDAGGDDDRSRAQGNAIFEGDLVHSGIAFEGKGLAGDGEAHAEFQGLHKGTVRQPLPRNANRESRDSSRSWNCVPACPPPGAMPSMTTVEETLRGSINGGGETGRSGPDHGDVIDDALSGIF